MDQAKAAMDTIFRTLHVSQLTIEYSVKLWCFAVMQQGEGGTGGLVVAEVIKAGSLGHGTAVPGHYDLDIVVYSESKRGGRKQSASYHCGIFTLRSRRS